MRQLRGRDAHQGRRGVEQGGVVVVRGGGEGRAERVGGVVGVGPGAGGVAGAPEGEEGAVEEAELRGGVVGAEVEVWRVEVSCWV